MKTAPYPDNESERHAALLDVDILDTAAEQKFDDLSILAAEICQCPIAYISIVDEDRQWFKSKVGLSIDQSERAISFCGHTILQDDLFIIEDTLKNSDFSDNPMVTGEPYIRFYAGMPLKVNGFNIGTICVVDTKPRKLNTHEQVTIKRLARQAVALIEARANVSKIDTLNRVLTKQNSFFEGLSNAFPAMVAYWDANLICQFANPQYLNGLKKTRDEVIGMHYQEVVSAHVALTTEAYVSRALAGEYCEFEATEEDPNQYGQIPIGLSQFRPHIDHTGAVIGLYLLVTDVSSFKKAEEGQKLFSRIFNQTSNAILITDQHYQTLSANKAFLEMHGYLEEEIIGKTPEFLSVNQDLIQSIRTNLNETGTYEGMVWGKKKNGDSIYCRMSVDCIYDQSGKVTHTVATIINQSENFKIKSDLQIANDMLERTGRMSRIGAWEHDLNTGEVIWTDELFKLIEVDSKIAPRFEAVINFYEPEARSLVREAIQKCIATGEPYELEVPIITAKQNHIWVRTTGELIKRDTVGYKLAGTFQDISERKTREKRHKQDEIDLRNTLVREIHHRIKNNLQGVSGILSHFAMDNPEYAGPFNEANAQLQSVAVLYGLQGTTPDASIDLSKLTSAITQNISSLWQTKIEFTMDKDSENVFLSKSESVPIALILNELITNAVKHQTRPNSVQTDLRFQKDMKSKSKNKIFISIINDGDYIGPPNKQAKPSSELGLGLMSSLMPKNGAYIRWNIGEPTIRVELELSYPVISK